MNLQNWLDSKRLISPFKRYARKTAQVRDVINNPLFLINYKTHMRSLMQIFRTKPITLDDSCETGLKRCLSAFDLTFLGIGAIIGTGIFVLTGIAAATQSGPAVECA